MSIKVCHLTSVHPPYDIRIFHKECRSLVSAGYEVSLVATGIEDHVREGVKMCGVARKGAGRLQRFVNTSRAVIERGLEVDADIYHIHDPELLPFVFKFKRRQKKVVYDAHEDLPKQTLSKEYIPFVFRKPLSLGLNLVENIIVQNIDAVVAATPSIQRRFRRVFPSAVNVNNFPFAAELVASVDGIERERVACYVGGIAPVRGIFEMLRSVELAGGVNLILAGEIKAGLKEQLLAEPGWGKVEYLGVVDRRGVAEAMARALVGLVVLKPVANHVEALPIKLFEYLSAGLPIVASDFKLWREMLEEANCAIFVDPNSVEEIAKAINWIVENPQEAREMGRRGRELILTKFNWENEEKKLVELYRQLEKTI